MRWAFWGCFPAPRIPRSVPGCVESTCRAWWAEPRPALPLVMVVVEEVGDQQGLWASPFRLLLYRSQPAWLILLAAPQPPWVCKSAKQGCIVLATVSHLTWGHRKAPCQGVLSCQQLTRGQARPWDCRPRLHLCQKETGTRVFLAPFDVFGCVRSSSFCTEGVFGAAVAAVCSPSRHAPGALIFPVGGPPLFIVLGPRPLLPQGG